MDGIRLRTTHPDDRVALRGVRIHATLVGLAQRTRIEQTFVNLEPRAIEAAYTFPLPDGAAVCGFEVVTGDRVLTGVVDENDAAVERYEDAIADGDAAYLAEQDRPDVFTVRVGNLKPKQAATVRITTVRPLEVVDGTIRIAFPTTLAPRYATDSGTGPLDAAIDGDALNPPHVLDVPYGLTLTADVDPGRPVRAITSATHPITVDGGRVTLAAADMDREVVISVDLAADVGAHVQVERGPDGASYLAVTFAPELAEVTAGDAPPPAEVVFVVDCSGSMQGESIAQATAALELCLRTLNAGDTFNVCRFGSTFELMAAEPLAYTDATLGPGRGVRPGDRRDARRHGAARAAGGRPAAPAGGRPRPHGRPADRRAGDERAGGAGPGPPPPRPQPQSSRSASARPSARSWSTGWPAPPAGRPSSSPPASGSRPRCCGRLPGRPRWSRPTCRSTGATPTCRRWPSCRPCSTATCWACSADARASCPSG